MNNSELILNPDGSIFHLHLLPHEIAPTIFLLGDPGRVETLSSFFDTVTVKKRNREFVTHTGSFKGVPVSAVSTGIGPDNIDIVLNELDALVNIDLETQQVKKKHTSLNFIRVGTSGALQKELLPGTRVVAQTALGLDGIANYYAGFEKFRNSDMEADFMEHMHLPERLAHPYFIKAGDRLLAKMKQLPGAVFGINATAPGFYAPQGRELRLKIIDHLMNEKLSSFSYEGLKINNYEMECAPIYALSALLGHQAVTVCQIIANRIIGEADANYRQNMKKLLQECLELVCA